jgi:alditol oxidase
MTEKQRNWAGNVEYSATNWHTPTTVEQLQDIVRNSNKVRGLGSRHSFNTIADSDDTIISLKQMNRIIEINADEQTVTVQGGITYGGLCKELHDRGFALHNLASLPHISIVGACTTATHGSGENNGNLATSVSAIEFMTTDGTLIRRNRAEHGDEFAGMVVSLGALGIVTQITLDIIPTFDMRQDVYLNLPLDTLYENFDAIQASAYSISLFTDWVNNTITQAWLKSVVDDDTPFTLGDTFFGAKSATVPCSPVGDDRTKRCTEQNGVRGAWYDRLPHFRMEFSPSHGDEIQSEYFVPRESAIEAIKAVNALHADITPLLYITEIRAIKADDLWLSTAYGRDSIALHFTWKPMWAEIRPVLEKIETALIPLGVRPHWGKVFVMSPEYVQSQYERLSDFQELARKYDPDGKFQNAFLADYL